MSHSEIKRTLPIAAVSGVIFGSGSYTVLATVHDTAWQTAYIIGIQVIVLGAAILLDTLMTRKP